MEHSHPIAHNLARMHDLHLHLPTAPPLEVTKMHANVQPHYNWGLVFYEPELTLVYLERIFGAPALGI